jgi:hypothetical protein
MKSSFFVWKLLISGSDFLHFVQLYMLYMTSLNQYMPHMQINMSVFQIMTSFQQRSQLSVCLVEMKSSFAYHFHNMTYTFHTCMMQLFQCLIWCGFGLTSCDSKFYVLVLVHDNEFMNIWHCCRILSLATVRGTGSGKDRVSHSLSNPAFI